ncbi:hypothetical protein U6A24_06965 [Aquimarina gracilis]|uniref:TonB-like protein n=1 Tax=Aquimarina gracilis TaxID=874422 RepID=A0ABU5ZT07_9FLAO|nr:hypothetical protein [Aquimarina gracilis]MEB3345192.1 hypothetical protein [Aquimarina gracilis]
MQPLSLTMIALITCFLSFSQSNFTTQKCKDVTNERLRKNCIIQEIQNYVDANYDITAISSDAKLGANRVYTRFRIDPTGKIVDIQTKAIAFPLEIEAIRVLESFPRLIPLSPKEDPGGQEDIFTLPIIFNVKKIEIELNASEKLTGGNQ